jgi:phage terminase large subunit-like protein
LPSKRRLEWPNGARSLIFTADEPERLRGKQHEKLWCDEVAAWRYGVEAWDQAMFGLRLGSDPQCVATTTPKPVPIVKDILKQANAGTMVKVTRGSSYANVDNLAPAFFDEIVSKYEGTRLGRQELGGELLEDVEGALWTLALIDRHRVKAIPEGVSLVRVVVAVDPNAKVGGAECGIVVAARGSDKRGYVLADRSKHGTPNEWANATIAAYDEFNADAVVIEVNQGGDMATNTLKTVRPTLPIKAVHASRGKATRAEPVSSLYEQGHVSHVGSFPMLEEQMTTWTPGDESPDRMDALVWGGTELWVGPKPKAVPAHAMTQTSRWT